VDRIAAGRVLGISPAAPDHGIERAFRAALRTTHPDQFPADSVAQRRAAARTRALLDARSVLLAPIDLRDTVTLSASAAARTRTSSASDTLTAPAPARGSATSAIRLDATAPASGGAPVPARERPGSRRSVLRWAQALFLAATLLLVIGTDHPGDSTVALGSLALVLAGVACLGHVFSSAGRPRATAPHALRHPVG
jgi:hypothetical protein